MNSAGTACSIHEACQIAQQRLQAGLIEDVEAICTQIVAQQPDHAEALHLLALVASQRRQHAVALEFARRADRITPGNANILNTIANSLAELGQYEEAVTSYRACIALNPRWAVAHTNLGTIFMALERPAEAIPHLRTAKECDPMQAEACYNLALAYLRLGQVSAAAEECAAALRIRPSFPEALNMLGNLLLDHGQCEAAIRHLEAALAARPNWHVAMTNLGNACMHAGDYAAAEDWQRRAAAAAPDHPAVHHNLGSVLLFRGHPEAAAAELREAIRLQPSYAEARSNLANALKEQGLLDQALEELRDSIALFPKDAQVHSTAIHILHNHPGYDEAGIRAALAEWNAAHAIPLRGARAPLTNSREPGRRLKVGYVSPDYYGHSISFFIAPLLKAHDRAAVESYCYSSVKNPDGATELIRGRADVWRDCLTLSDEQLAAQIRADGIDILVDLTMHTAGSRLRVFAMKPAPILASWLAYPGTTGVETMDYRIADRYIEPDPAPEAWGERPVQLPDTWCVFEPVGDFVPVTELPALESGYVTFGSLSNFCKVTEPVLRCWARLLVRVPHSHLATYCPAGVTRERVGALFAEYGVSPDRLDLISRSPWNGYVAHLGRADIALDPYPCNGMTITVHSLYMGVPVVTLPGRTAASRAGRSLMTVVGLPEFVAESEDHYIEIAAAWANDLQRLAALRAGLRSRMESSPLMDAPRFARNMEAAYRAMWREWCSRAG